MLANEQKEQFSDILEALGQTLDISKEQHDAAVTSYTFVGEWLSDSTSILAPYKPEILPQGSFMLGTMIKPIGEDDELDIDLVCRLEGKQANWTQADVKRIVGERLVAHGTLQRLLKRPDGRRCWTLEYADSAKFHMDVLPSLVSSGYVVLMERMFSASSPDFERLAIRITDNKEPNYRTEIMPEGWPKSNPFGYGIWFENKAKLAGREIRLMSEAVRPVPKYQKAKLPLQRVIQILKRHRDMMFNGDEDKPISIIITTLAARAYNKESDIINALLNISSQIPQMIEERYSPKHGKVIKWIPNPVNPEENFADKWAEPGGERKEVNFYKWIGQVQSDIHEIISKQQVSLVMEAMKKPFGENMVKKTFVNYGDNLLKLRESGQMKMAAGTAMLGTVGRTDVPQHKPFGNGR